MQTYIEPTTQIIHLEEVETPTVSPSNAETPKEPYPTPKPNDTWTTPKAQ